MPLDTLHQIRDDLAASGHFSDSDDVDVAQPDDDEGHRPNVTAKVYYETIGSDEEDSELGTDEIVIRIYTKDASDATEGQSQMANRPTIKIDLPGGYPPGATSFDLDSAADVVVGDLFETVSLEVVQVLTVSGNTITVTRAKQGTTAAVISDNEVFTNLQAGTYAGFEYYFKGNRTTRGRYSYNAGGAYNSFTRVTSIGQPSPISSGSDSDNIGRSFFEVSLESFRG